MKPKKVLSQKKKSVKEKFLLKHQRLVDDVVSYTSNVSLEDENNDAECL